jgi:GAF domain-containing protein
MVARGSAPERVFAQVAEEVGLLVAAESAMVFHHRPDGETAVVGTWGQAPADPDDPAFGAAVRSPVVVEGRPWGAIVAASTTSALPADAEDQIAQFTDLVATAISNVQARSDLAASRARLVAAADEERRRVVRDLHDGAQQRIMHTVVTL